MSKQNYNAARAAFEDALSRADKDGNEIMQSVVNGLLSLTAAVESDLAALKENISPSEE